MISATACNNLSLTTVISGKKGINVKFQLLVLNCLILLVFSFSNLNARDDGRIAHIADSLFDVGLKEKMLPGGIVSVVRNDTVLFTKGYGFADVENNIPVNAGQTLFQIGSVGKILTAMAVLKLVESGALNPDADIREYLTGLSLTASFQSPVTLRHLLTHTAGINEQVIGYAARSAADVRPLEAYLEESFPGFFQPPGKSISYSNIGYALAGLIVQRVSGMSFPEFLNRQIFTPLQMETSTYLLPDNPKNNPDYARGYYPTREGFAEQEPIYTHPKPAGGLNATATDMANLMAMFLSDGRFMGEKVLAKESLDWLLQRQFTNHPDLTGYTFGFEEQQINGSPAVAKGGQTFGFTSVFLLLPAQNCGVFISVNIRSGKFVELLLDHLTREFLPAQNPPSLAAAPQIAVDLNRFAGAYRSNRYNHDSIENLFALFRDNLTFQVDSEGYLSCYRSGSYQQYEALSPLTFRNRQDSDDLLVFKENGNGNIDEMYLTGTFAGISLPLSYEKVAWYSAPHFVNEFFLSYVPMHLLLYLLFPLVWLAIKAVQLKKKGFLQGKSLPLMAHLSALLFGILSIVYAFKYIAPLNHLGLKLLFGVPDEFIKFSYIPFILLMLLIPLGYFTYKMWREKVGGLIRRLFYTSYFLIAIIFLGFLQNWNFLL